MICITTYPPTPLPQPITISHTPITINHTPITPSNTHTPIPPYSYTIPHYLSSNTSLVNIFSMIFETPYFKNEVHCRAGVIKEV